MDNVEEETVLQQYISIKKEVAAILAKISPDKKQKIPRFFWMNRDNKTLIW